MQGLNLTQATVSSIPAAGFYLTPQVLLQDTGNIGTDTQSFQLGKRWQIHSIKKIFPTNEWLRWLDNLPLCDIWGCKVMQVHLGKMSAWGHMLHWACLLYGTRRWKPPYVLWITVSSSFWLHLRMYLCLLTQFTHEAIACFQNVPQAPSKI